MTPCTYCRSPRHTTVNCPKTWGGQARRAQMRCAYCGDTSHNVAACPKTYEGSARRQWNPQTVEDDFIQDKGAA